ncbi:MAG: tetratricopeptide repeat protein [Bacteroidales bacterium]|uniref:tetratricopeptide repeat protein n=1 Tax=Porphyromonas sp. TaxID=1924944 RepID=UPI002978F74A|nr:tetratricopeptide repeat protein [Porphyromonas sp.]MDD7438631.1 tetratricopeptide repeat protein [Bacteroidales bacterium]MDY3067887.1 tetratricopeptide repeat protein [Porphyromonas sp.]
MKRLLLYIIVLSISASQFSFATTMNEGIAAYQETNYTKAIELFTQVLSENGSTAEAYYNLASAYYKNGNIGPAVLNFHRAYRLDPSDGDTRYNLRFVSSQVTDKIEETPKLFISRWLDSLSHWFGLSTWRALSAIFIVLVATGVFFYFRGRSITTRRIGFYGGVCSVVLALLVNIMAYRSYSFTHENKEAILMSSITTIKSSPDASAKDIAVVHEGLHVKTLQNLSGYTEVRLPDGTVGWIPMDSYELINDFD